MKINLLDFGSVINDKETGEALYSAIKVLLKENNTVEVNFSGVITMATFCAKQTFGRLYVELGPQDFFNRLVLKNANSDLKFIVRTGIESALTDATTK